MLEESKEEDLLLQHYGQDENAEVDSLFKTRTDEGFLYKKKQYKVI